MWGLEETGTNFRTVISFSDIGFSGRGPDSPGVSSISFVYWCVFVLFYFVLRLFGSLYDERSTLFTKYFLLFFKTVLRGAITWWPWKQRLKKIWVYTKSVKFLFRVVNSKATLPTLQSVCVYSSVFKYILFLYPHTSRVNSPSVQRTKTVKCCDLVGWMDQLSSYAFKFVFSWLFLFLNFPIWLKVCSKESNHRSRLYFL